MDQVKSPNSRNYLVHLVRSGSRFATRAQRVRNVRDPACSHDRSRRAAPRASRASRARRARRLRHRRRTIRGLAVPRAPQRAPRDASLPHAHEIWSRRSSCRRRRPAARRGTHARGRDGRPKLVAADIAGAGSPLASEARAKPYAALLAIPALAGVAAAIRAADRRRRACDVRCARRVDTVRELARGDLLRAFRRHARGARAARSVRLDRRRRQTSRATMIAARPRRARRCVVRSPWFAPDAPALHATVRGDVSAEFAAHPVTRTVRWTEDETYTGREVQTWRRGTTPIELHREMPRTFGYAAVERVGTYSSELHVDVEPLGIGASESAAFTRSGDDTDVQNDEAGVTPSRAESADARAFLGRRARDAGRSLAHRARARVSRARVQRQRIRGRGRVCVRRSCGRRARARIGVRRRRAVTRAVARSLNDARFGNRRRGVVRLGGGSAVASCARCTIATATIKTSPATIARRERLVEARPT